MKHVSVLALSAMTTIGVIPFGAYAAPVSHLHANSIAAHNIMVMQRSAMLNAFDNFDGSAAITLGEPTVAPQAPEEDTQPAEDPTEKYGKMPTYGEYGDDGTVFLSGRSGGEFPVLNSNWIDWQYSDGLAKFDGFSRVDSKSNVISLGFSDEASAIKGGFSEFGGFGGVILAQEDAGSVELSETGEYIGLYRAYNIYGFSIKAAADFGALFNDAESALGDYDFTNLWAGAALNLSYNIVLDETSTIQPGVYAGYTWINSDGYKSDSGKRVSIDDFHMFEVSPSLRAITHIGDGWFGIMSGRYVFNYVNGGDATIAGVTLPELEMKDYSEYGLSVEKTSERFSVAASIYRRDGGRAGWLGGLQIRYLF